LIDYIKFLKANIQSLLMTRRKEAREFDRKVAEH